MNLINSKSNIPLNKVLKKDFLNIQNLNSQTQSNSN